MVELFEQTLHEGRIGIIDIGSNSVRLVIFDQRKRCPLPLYNEKAMCALGKGLATTGKLNTDGVTHAKASIDRFLALARNMEVVELHVIATAAVRDAADGPAFVDWLENAHGVDVAVISGRKEAKLGAYGICASVYAPHGLTGDLGGGSMELVHLEGSEIRHHATLPIGQLRMLDETHGDRQAMRKTISRRFTEIDWLEPKTLPHFYAIGGSFRALAKAHLLQADYPLRVLHQYTVKAKEMLEFAEKLAGMAEEKIAGLPGISGKRAAAMPPAAMVLQEVIERAKPERVVFSASGIREGYLYEKLSPYLRKEDPLLAGAADLIVQSGRLPAYGQELFLWMYPLFPKETDRERRLRLAACLLGEAAWSVHPEYRGEWAYQRVLQSPLVGLDHKERVQLALAIFHRHQSRPRALSALSLLDKEQRQWARVVGAAAALAYHLGGSIAGNLHKTALSLPRGEVMLTFSAGAGALMGEAVKKRIDALGEALKEP